MRIIRQGYACVCILMLCACNAIASDGLNIYFNHNRGIYTDSFNLALSATYPNAVIRYTLDCSILGIDNGEIYSSPISISKTTVVKAIAYVLGVDTSRVITSTYLFTTTILNQESLPNGFPSVWGGSSTISADYEMDQEVVDNPAYRNKILEAIYSVPSLCLSMPMDEWFNHNTGLYVGYPNTSETREKSVTAEFILNDDEKSIEISCGVQNQGGTCIINWKVPKQSMRLVFKEQYGSKRLNAKLFPNSNIESINTLVVDGLLYGWVHPFDNLQHVTSLFFRDQLASDIQNNMGGLSFHGRYMNLYINGLYWGIYDVHERPDDAFVAEYNNAAREDFDVLKHRVNTVVSGSNLSYLQLLNQARQGFSTYDRLIDIKDKLDLPAFIDYNLYPATNPPVISSNGVELSGIYYSVENTNTISLINPNSEGTIYYSMDGTDPREVGSDISGSAINGGSNHNVEISSTTVLNARILNGNEWSALRKLILLRDEDLSALQITEIHYHPHNSEFDSINRSEFIELKNTGAFNVNLTATSFSNGISYSFPDNTILEPGKFIVLASNNTWFENQYGFAAFDVYSGKLSNGGENIVLVKATGDTILAIDFNDKEPWPLSADGVGFSLVPKTSDYNSDWMLPENWRASTFLHGSPNTDDPISNVSPIIISEVLTSTKFPQADAIELWNPNGYAVDIGGWYLSNSRNNIQKWQIPMFTTIPPNSYLVFYEGYYENNNLSFSSKDFGDYFSLDSYGDDVHLFSANLYGELTGYQHGFKFDAIDWDLTIGRHKNSVGNVHFVAQKTNSLLYENTIPHVGPLVINEIMYNPVDGDNQYISIKNISTGELQCFDETTGIPWRVKGISFQFPAYFTINEDEIIYITDDKISPEEFRITKQLSTQTRVFNFGGQLNKKSDAITILKSFPTVMDDSVIVYPEMVIDKVEYNIENWPNSNQAGYSIVRKNSTLYGNDPENWLVKALELFITTIELHEGNVGVNYSKNLEVVGGEAPYSWEIENGNLPEGLMLDGASIEGIPNSTGSYSFTLKVEDNNGQIKTADLTITILDNIAPVAINDTVYTFTNINANFNALKNDIDADGDRVKWRIRLLNEPLRGSISINNDNTLSYIPNSGYTGTDNLNYELSDDFDKDTAEIVLFIDDYITETKVAVKRESDDAEEIVSTQVINLTSTDLEMVMDGYNQQLVGLRFAKGDMQGKTNSTQNLNGSGSTDENNDSLTYWWDIISQPFGSLAQLNNDSSMISQFIPDLPGVYILSLIVNDGFQSSLADSLFIHIHDNTTPIANAGGNSTWKVESTVQLSAINSHDFDGDMLNYQWDIISKPILSTATLNNNHSINPSFIPNVTGNYQIMLQVNDGTINSIPDTIEIHVVENHVPIANSGENMEIPINAIKWQ